MLLRFIVPFFIAVGLPTLAKATHIVGGEITYECLGNNKYELTLKVYRDCFYGKEPFDNPGYIGIYNLRGDLIQTIQVRPGMRDTLEPTLDDPCLVVPPDVCVDTVTYKTVVNLSNNPVGGAYQITYVRCCRNETIDNIIDPVETGAVYDIYLTREAMLQCNNSPVYNNLPPNYICANKPFIFDHSATDPDGDSLVYRLCTPFSGGSISNPRPIPPRNPPPFDEVQWQIGFGLDNLFGMGEPLRIDERTGQLTAVPGLQGQFVVGVCVEEYDRETGQLLSFVRRDFQYNVGVCGTTVSSFFAPEISCDRTVQFNNQSINTQNFRWYFDFPRTNLTSTEKSPTFTFPAEDTYTVALIAEPGGVCADTFFQEITIRENTIAANFSIEVFDCQDDAVLSLQDFSNDPNSPVVKWEWTVTYGDLVTLTSNVKNPRFVVPLGAQGTIRLKVTTADGCSKTLEKPFETGVNPPPTEMISDTITACQGSSIELNPMAANSANLVYRWSPGNLVSDSTAANPLFIGNQSATLTVRITQDTAICEVSKQVRVVINPTPRVDLGADRTICLQDSITLTANVTSGKAPYQYAWNRGSGQSQRVSPVLSTTYIVTVTDANGCIGVDSVRVNVNSVPGVIVSADDNSICVGDSTIIRATVNAGTPPLTYTWNQGLGNMPNHLVKPTQTTTYAVTVTDANGCSASDDIRVNVSARPTAEIDTVFCNTNLISYQVDIVTNAATVTATAGVVVNNGGGAFSIINIPNGQNVDITAASSDCETIINVNAPLCVCPDLAAPISGGNRSICIGESLLALTVSVPNGQTADWFDAPTGGNLLLESSVSFTPTQAGTYYARARDLATGCTSATRTAVTLSINPNPSATAGAAVATVCAGDEVQLNANATGGTAPYQFNWSEGLGQGQNPVATPLLTTVYVVTVTDDKGCSDTAQVTINVDPLPRIDSIKTSCSTDLQTYSVRVVTNGNAVNATLGTVTSLGNGVFVISGIPISQNLVFVSTFNATNCGRRVSVTRPDCQCPDIDAPISGGDHTICAGQPIPALTVSVGENQTADWYSAELGGDTLLLGSTSFTPLQAGVYYAVARDTITQCTSRVRTAVRLTINTALTVNATASQTEICEGQSTNLTATVSGGTAPFTYNWNQGLGMGQNKTVTPTQTTTYIVTVGDDLGCAGADTITITVNPRPTATINADQSIICAGDTATLTASATGGNTPYTFNWNQGLGSGAIKRVSPVQTTIYQIVINDGKTCSDTAQVTITVNPKPQVQLSANRTTVCAGDTTRLNTSVSGGTAPYSFDWSIDTLNGANPIVTITQTTTYIVTVTDSNGCSNMAQITINAINALDVNVTANDSTLCPGQSADLSVNVQNGATPYTYRWNEGLPANAAQTVMPSATTTYSITVTDANGCFGTDSIVITVNPNPSVLATASDSIICEGTSTNLSAIASDGTALYTFTWNPGGLSGQNQTVSPNDTTVYTVLATDANGCSASDSITIFVTPKPSVSVGASDLTICLGDSTTLTASANGALPPYTFNWSNGLGAGANKTVAPTQTTTYTVTTTDANSCQSIDSVTITVLPNLNVSISATPSSICEGDSTRLMVTVSGGRAPYAYRWDPNILGNPDQTIRPTQTTTYGFTVTDANGCTGIAAITITVNPKPAVNITTDKDMICAGEAVTLTAEATGTGNLMYQWSNGASGNQQTVNPTETTTYVATVTDGNGCSDVDSVTILVNPRPATTIQASPSTICLGGSSVLTVTTTGGTAPYTFQWNQNLGTNDSVTVSPTQTTTYEVIVTDANGCSDTAQVTITVTPGLNVSISANDSTLCEGDTATLTAASDGLPPFTYVWNQGLSNNSTHRVSPLQTTTYIVTITDSDGCVGTDSIRIGVSPRPTIQASADKDTICAGDAVVLTAQGAGGTGNLNYQWSNGVMGTSQIVNPTQTTVYTVTVTDTNGCTNRDTTTASVRVVVNPRPDATIQASPSTICLGGSSVLTVTTTGGTALYTFQWNQNLGTNDTVTVSPTQTTTYSLTITDANGCRDTAQVTITVTPGLTATIAANDSVLCEGQKATLTVNSDGLTPFTYQWNQGLPASTTQMVMPLQTTTYSVTVTDANGCVGMDSITITVNPSPEVEVAADQDTICAGEPVRLTAAGSGGVGTLMYRWSNGASGNQQTVNPTETTTYTLTVTDANGCTNIPDANDSVRIVVNPRPDATIQASPSTICLGGSSVLTVTTTGGTAPYTFQWNQNLGTNDSVTVSPTQTTTYEVIVTDANGCSDTAQVTITVTPGLDVNLTTNTGVETICQGDSITLNTNVGNGLAPYTFTWNPSLPNTQNPRVSPSQTTTYRVTVTDANGCVGTDSITIIVNPAPTVVVAASMDTICTGERVTLTAQGSGGTSPLTYRWSNGVTEPQQVVTPNQTTTYIVTVTDANGCTNNNSRDTITIVVHPRPIANAGPDTVACSGGSITLQASASNGTPPYTFNWSQDLGTGASVIITPSQPNTYKLTVTDANGCTATDEVFVDVFPLPTDLPQDSITACANVPTALAPNIVPRPGADYTWTPPGILNDAEVPNPTITVNKDTTVFVTITYQGVCTVLDTVHLSVPPAINLQVSNDTTICDTLPLQLRASSSVAAVQYEWSNNRNFTSILGRTNTLTVTPNGSTIYYARASDANGCSEMDSVVINAFPIRATITPAQVLCEPTNEVRLAVANPDAVQVLNYIWKPANAILTRPDSSVVLVNPSVATDFTVELVNQFGCRDTLQTKVEVVNLQITATADPDTIFGGQTVQLNAIGGCPNCIYSWTPPTGLNNPNIANPIASPTETTLYRVLVTVGNCTDEASVRVVVNNVVCDKEHIFLPSAFTPNGDGVNDYWQIRSNFLDQLRVSTWVLYNRWGQKIFETTDVNYRWDGTFRGQPLPPDVYGYYARIVCPGNEELVLQGNLTLIR